MANSNPTKVVTREVRLSYVHLFEPFANNPDEDPQYSCMILIPKTDTVTLGKLDAAIKAAAEQGKASKFGGTIPKNLKTTLRDGDEEIDTDESPEYKGMMFMNVSSWSRKPGVVDRDINPILDSTEVYSGCYARVSLGAFAFNSNGSKGVSFGLNHVQKTRDGDPLDGSTKATDDFDVWDEDEDDDDLL